MRRTYSEMRRTYGLKLHHVSYQLIDFCLIDFFDRFFLSSKNIHAEVPAVSPDFLSSFSAHFPRSHIDMAG